MNMLIDPFVVKILKSVIKLRYTLIVFMYINEYVYINNYVVTRSYVIIVLVTSN